MSQVPYPPADNSLPTFWTAEREPYGNRIARFVAISVAVHIAAALLLVAIAPHLPDTRVTRQIVALRDRATELVAPPMQITQREANRGNLSKEFTVESIQRNEAAPALPSPGSAPRPALSGKRFKLPDLPSPAPKSTLPDAPNVDVGARLPSQAPPPGLGVPGAPPPPPQIQTEEKPKLAFERPGAQIGAVGQRGTIPLPRPSTVEEAVRSSIGRGGGMVVGDVEEGSSSAVPGLRPSPQGGRMGSSLELLSDPQGADFRPYLTKLLSAVRRNWFAIIPESARFGRQGKVLVRFSVGRDGTVQNFQITGASGTEAFDRAAVAAISASNPFLPLPGEFKGGWVRLQLTFLYNLR